MAGNQYPPACGLSPCFLVNAKRGGFVEVEDMEEGQLIGPSSFSPLLRSNCESPFGIRV